ncbi:M28 family peptidase [Lentimicrobium sp. S6]|uniref:M28 family peptidase n=1 Tax=Lentimicrobium sp. S6 TaxID=2735872 RepID=UPI001552E327|nr:M28 family peptidase [Lentimicrobium sp. S6]NPD45371.1 M20/M25/M40 family metallo-hydrolase [Lentimicrobium sp. S6]
MKKHILTFLVILISGINVIAQVEVSADSLKKHVYVLASDSLEGRGLSTHSGLKAAHYIAGYFKEFGLETIGDSYLHPFNTYFSTTNLVGHNVIALIEGSDSKLKDEYIVLGAHYDHVSFYYNSKGEKIIYNGADDNASGTSGVIELGRALKENSHLLKRSVILIAFDGEESGLIGSTKVLKQEFFPADDIKLMMSIDMIGRYSESQQCVIGAMASVNGGNDILEEVAKNHQIKIKNSGKKVSQRTDSGPFGDFGIPALYISSGIVGPYHKPQDDAETIDYNGMKEITELLFDLTIKLAEQEKLEPSKYLIAQTKNGGVPRLRYGLKASFGSSHHHYSDDFYNGKNKFSYEIGLMTQLKITKNISLLPEVLYSSMGSGFPDGNFRTQSISTPVSLVLASGMGQMNSRFYVSAGAYYSYHFSGKAGGESLDFENRFHQSETGLVFGIGLEVSSIFVSLNFKNGFSEIMKEQDAPKMSSRASYFTIGYMF